MATMERHPTPEVAIRPALAEDAELLWRWRAEWSVRRFQPLHELSAQQLREDLEAQSMEDLYRAQGEKFQWIVFHHGRPAGWLTLVVNNWEHGLAEVGYALATAHQGRRVMVRALRLLLDDLFARAALHRIEARCAVDNIPSRKVLEACGFRYEGRLRSYFELRGRRVDNLLYSLLESDLVAP